MNTGRIRTRLAQVEKRAGISPAPALVVIIRMCYLPQEVVPNVIDRPLQEWELYKQAPVQRRDGHTWRVVKVDPFAEYQLRTGRSEAPPEDTIPGEVFEGWQHSDRH